MLLPWMLVHLVAHCRTAGRSTRFTPPFPSPLLLVSPCSFPCQRVTQRALPLLLLPAFLPPRFLHENGRANHREIALTTITQRAPQQWRPRTGCGAFS